MSIKKQYLKKDGVCKVTFSLTGNVDSIENVKIPGDFNNWDTMCEPMKKLKTGGFTQSVTLDSGKVYQFKYLINDQVWVNDPDSDQFAANGYGPGEQNSVIVL